MPNSNMQNTADDARYTQRVALSELKRLSTLQQEESRRLISLSNTHLYHPNVAKRSLLRAPPPPPPGIPPSKSKYKNLKHTYRKRSIIKSSKKNAKQETVTTNTGNIMPRNNLGSENSLLQAKAKISAIEKPITTPDPTSRPIWIQRAVAAAAIVAAHRAKPSKKVQSDQAQEKVKRIVSYMQKNVKKKPSRLYPSKKETILCLDNKTHKIRKQVQHVKDKTYTMQKKVYTYKHRLACEKFNTMQKKVYTYKHRLACEKVKNTMQKKVYTYKHRLACEKVKIFCEALCARKLWSYFHQWKSTRNSSAFANSEQVKAKDYITKLKALGESLIEKINDQRQLKISSESKVQMLPTKSNVEDFVNTLSNSLNLSKSHDFPVDTTVDFKEGNSPKLIQNNDLTNFKKDNTINELHSELALFKKQKEDSDAKYKSKIELLQFQLKSNMSLVYNQSNEVDELEKRVASAREKAMNGAEEAAVLRKDLHTASAEVAMKTQQLGEKGEKERKIIYDLEKYKAEVKTLETALSDEVKAHEHCEGRRRILQLREDELTKKIRETVQCYEDEKIKHIQVMEKVTVLEARLTAKSKEDDSQIAEIELMKSIIERQEQKLLVKDEKLNELQKKCEDKATIIDASRQNIALSKEENETLRTTNLKLHEQICAAHERAESFSAAAEHSKMKQDTCEDEIRSVRAELVSLKNKYEERCKNLIAKNDEQQERYNQLELDKNTIQDASKTSQASIIEKLQKRDEEICEMRAISETVKEANEALKRDKSFLEEELVSIRELCSSQQNKINVLMGEMNSNNHGTEKLQAQLEKRSSIGNQLVAEIQRVESEESKIRAQLVAMSVAKNEAELELANEKRKLSDVNRELENTCLQLKHKNECSTKDSLKVSEKSSVLAKLQKDLKHSETERIKLANVLLKVLEQNQNCNTKSQRKKDSPLLNSLQGINMEKTQSTCHNFTPKNAIKSMIDELDAANEQISKQSNFAHLNNSIAQNDNIISESSMMITPKKIDSTMSAELMNTIAELDHLSEVAAAGNVSHI